MRRQHAFTLIELLVVLGAMALLLAIAAPRYLNHVDQAREIMLRQNLLAVRDALDKFNADRARYPKNLQELVTERYLRTLPIDPVTDRDDTWVLVPAPSQTESVADLHSGATGLATDGSAYASW